MAPDNNALIFPTVIWVRTVGREGWTVLVPFGIPCGPLCLIGLVARLSGSPGSSDSVL